MLTTQCKDMWLIYVVYTTTISRNYEEVVGFATQTTVAALSIVYCLNTTLATRQ